MGPRKRISVLIVIMAVSILLVESLTISMLYRTAIREEKSRLRETATGQARLIESVARFNDEYGSGYPQGSREAVLRQIIDAHNHYNGSGRTGQFSLAKREGNHIVYILDHRHHDYQHPKPVPLDSELDVPMKLALSGKSGTMVGLDYRGEKVLAAFEPVAGLSLGIVNKVDLSEVRAPFIGAGLLSGLLGVLAIAFGTVIFIRVTSPLLHELQDTIEDLQNALARVKLLSGLLPICSSCKKIRDDKGYWNQIESYIREHSEAEFSHGICPDCAKKLYPGFYREISFSSR
jgi:hypothetical protein